MVKGEVLKRAVYKEIMRVGWFQGVMLSDYGTSKVPRPHERRIGIHSCVVQISRKVSNQLNKLYLKFLKRNPGYDGKVSIYGHSLGSVISYDILCHQETLYSPFPMDWLYHEQNKSEPPCPIRNNSSSDIKIISNFEEHSLANSEVESIVTHPDNSVCLEETVEGTYNDIGPESTELDKSTTIGTGYYRAIDENCSEPFGNLNQTSHLMNKCNSIKNEVVACDDGKNVEGVSDNDKDGIIKSLREEVDMLKAKLEELEADCADKVDARKSTISVNQSEPESAQLAHRDILKSYTPLIRYTKLEFKADTFFAVGSPLGVFLSLRNVRIDIGKGKDYWEEENINEEMPACRQMFNIFHPFDPVAYRIEPLVCKEFIHKRPVIVPYHRGGKRLYVGFQWRKGLRLSGEAAVDKITLDGVRGLRTMLSATVHDVLYYMSPIYCQDIIDSGEVLKRAVCKEIMRVGWNTLFRKVSNQLNKLYLKFLKRNPGYDGKVSIYGHSLGSVISYDILCHQETLYSPFPMDWLYHEQNRSEPPCPIRNNSSSDVKIISNFEEHSLANSEVESIVTHPDNSGCLEETVDGTYNHIGPESTELEKSTTIGTGSYQAIDEKCSETVGNLNQTSHLMNKCNSIKNEVVACDDGKNVEGVSDNDKDGIIKSLREEVDMLKAKLEELEADCAVKVDARKSPMSVNQSEPESSQLAHRDILKSYTPLIRYTKLEFKADTFFAVGSPLGVFLSLRNVRIGIGNG
ncbi:hypothetical protein OROGR_027846 [Orobanche gracilis]